MFLHFAFLCAQYLRKAWKEFFNRSFPLRCNDRDLIALGPKAHREGQRRNRCPVPLAHYGAQVASQRCPICLETWLNCINMLLKHRLVCIPLAIWGLFSLLNPTKRWRGLYIMWNRQLIKVDHQFQPDSIFDSTRLYTVVSLLIKRDGFIT